MADYKKNLPELKSEFHRQLKILNSHCLNFDKGDVDYALEIATKIRLLLHDTRRSSSLLAQIYESSSVCFFSETPFLSSQYPYTQEEVSNTKFTRTGLVFYKARIENHSQSLFYAESHPHLGQAKNTMWTDFNTWWEKDIMLIVASNIPYTRKMIITYVSNKLGGAHIDPKIDTHIQNLLENLSPSVKVQCETQVLNTNTNTLLLSIIRQIAFEFLTTVMKIIKPYFKTNKYPFHTIQHMEVNRDRSAEINLI